MALMLAAAAAHGQPKQTFPQTVPAPAYSSAFDAYQRYADQLAMSWREANDTVGRIGGWRSYVKEATREAPPPVPEAAASAVTPVHQGVDLGVRPEGAR